jgi:hypothetical protein
MIGLAIRSIYFRTLHAYPNLTTRRRKSNKFSYCRNSLVLPRLEPNLGLLARNQ